MDTRVERVLATLEAEGVTLPKGNAVSDQEIAQAIVDAVFSREMGHSYITTREMIVAAELADRLEGEFADAPGAKVVRDLIDKARRFQKLWVESIDSMRENEVRPAVEESKRLRELVAGDMTPERMEEALKLHYNAVVRPVNQYCDALRTYMNVISDKVAKAEAEMPPHSDTCKTHQGRFCDCEAEEQWTILQQWKPVAEAFKVIYPLPIMKSNLLARLIYMGEDLRTEPCPVHKGRWSGYAMDDKCECSLGWADITGWLPNKKEDDGKPSEVQSADSK